MAYFATEFGFNSTEVVALMGIHTLGQAVTDNSGFVVSHGSAARGSNLATALPVFHQKQGRSFLNQIKGRGGITDSKQKRRFFAWFTLIMLSFLEEEIRYLRC